MSSAVINDLNTYGPDHCRQLSFEQASGYALDLVRKQYENFTVISRMLPKALRRDFAHVYAFCRWADDLGDETGDPSRSMDLLNWWRSELDRCYDRKPRHPVFVALDRTVQQYDIPRDPFDHLIDAFIQDQQIKRYSSFNQLLEYCSGSANPVGRLVLYLCGYRDQQRQQLSDATCTALQLANFWQDVRRDIIQRDRVYIPSDIASEHGLDIGVMVRVVQLDCEDHDTDGTCSTDSCACHGPSRGMRAVLVPYQRTIHDLVERTWPMFRKGRELWPLIRSDLRPEIKLFSLGGEAVLTRIRRSQYNTLTHRPTLGTVAKGWLMLRVMAAKLTG